MLEFERELRQLARIYGVEIRYRDGGGKVRRASSQSILAVLAALHPGLEGPGDVSDALGRHRARQARERFDVVSVIRSGEKPRLRYRPQATGEESVGVVLTCEDGTERTARVRPRAIPSESADAYLPLPWTLAPGYYSLRVADDDGEGETQLIVAPPTSYVPRRGRMWGVFMPLYALRSDHGWGCGDLEDLQALGSWARGLGASAVGTLPLLPTFLDQPYDPSPYNPVSRLFWNELFLSLEWLPERSLLRASPDREREWAALRVQLQRQPLVDYRQVMALKRQVLEGLSQGLSLLPERERSFADWVEKHPRAREYAAFRAARELGEDPDHWARLSAYPSFCSRERYHLYVQWNMEQQLSRLAGGERGGLYLDLPLGVHPKGYDQWRWSELFAPASVGAPSDAFFTGGQDWGFRPLHPHRMRQEGYSYFIACLRHHLRWAHSLRLDHVAWLRRLFWIPAGGSAADGVYVRYPREELYAILCLEAQRHRTLLVGEDLGTMPQQLAGELVGKNIQRMYVLGLEEREDPCRLPLLPRSRMVSLNTHDLPLFSAFWGQLGHSGRTWWRRCLGKQRGRRRPPLLLALEHLARSRARFLLVNLEDLWGEEKPQNQPGTSGPAHPNWRRKAALTLRQITGHPVLRAYLRGVHRWRSHGKSDT